jgi:hypothetical protein
MREKIYTFMALTGFDQHVEQLAQSPARQLANEFKKGFGEELPAEPSEAAQLMERVLLEQKDKLRDAYAAIYDSYLSDSDLDVLIAFHESDTQKRLQAVTPEIQDKMTTAMQEWQRAAFAALEPEFRRILGASTPLAPIESPSETPKTAP